MEISEKCVGIVTIEDFTNYGNRLQNYALTCLLEKEGFRVINGITVITKETYVLDSNSTLKRFFKHLIPFELLHERNLSKTKKIDSLIRERERKFEEYVNRYSVRIAPIVARNYKVAMQLLSEFGIDFYIVGSDQVWNPYHEGRSYEFLTFAPEEKRLSFAASIGTDIIPSEKEKQYKKYLNGMKYLSVREQRAVEIIKELTGRDADLTLDPTLLLEPEEWDKVVKKPGLELDEHYICTYFLGETPEAVQQFAREKGLRIYALNSQESPELFTLDPGEFLYMIKSAAYVLTDSFHAVAFSIKFHKEFYVFCRKQANTRNMFSRIETITKRFGLGNRIQSRDAIVEQPPVTHWETIDREMLTEKAASMQRLLIAMETL